MSMLASQIDNGVDATCEIEFENSVYSPSMGGMWCRHEKEYHHGVPATVEKGE